MNETHHNQEPPNGSSISALFGVACDCREALMAESMQIQRRVIDWRDQSDEGLRLRCGELTAQEIRSIRAVLNAILPTNAKGDSQSPVKNL